MTAMVTEKDWQSTVVEYARLTGWLCYHSFDSRRSEPGFPDLVLVRAGRLIFSELKRDGEKLSTIVRVTKNGRRLASQQEWHDDLQETSAEVYEWQPSDWPEVEETLR